MKPTQHAAMSIPNYHMQNGYSPNGTFLHAGAQPNGLTVQQIPLKGAFTNGQDMPVNNRAAYIGHVVSNGANFNLPAVGVTNLTNLKLAPSRTIPWAAQRGSPAVAIAQSLSPHMHAHSPTPQVSPPRGGQTPTASPSLHQQQMVNGTGY